MVKIRMLHGFICSDVDEHQDALERLPYCRYGYVILRKSQNFEGFGSLYHGAAHEVCQRLDARPNDVVVLHDARSNKFGVRREELRNISSAKYNVIRYLREIWPQEQRDLYISDPKITSEIIQMLVRESSWNNPSGVSGIPNCARMLKNSIRKDGIEWPSCIRWFRAKDIDRLYDPSKAQAQGADRQLILRALKARLNPRFQRGVYVACPSHSQLGQGRNKFDTPKYHRKAFEELKALGRELGVSIRPMVKQREMIKQHEGRDELPPTKHGRNADGIAYKKDGTLRNGGLPRADKGQRRKR